MALGLRYPGAVTMTGEFDNSLRSNKLPQEYTVSGNLTYISSPRRTLYLAPSRYSEVRSVTFWMVITNHRDQSPKSTNDLRLRVGLHTKTPANGLTKNNIDTVDFGSGSFLRITNGVGANLFNNFTQNANTIFPWPGEGTIQPQNDYGIAGYRESFEEQLYYTTFDRFEPLSTEFFNLWDAFAADGDDNICLCFRSVIEELGVATSTATEMPGIVSFGVSVVQAPAAQNNTCTIWPCSIGQYDNSGVTSALSGKDVYHVPFFFEDDDWDNITEIRCLIQQEQDNTNTPNGRFRFQLVDVLPNEGDLLPENVLLQEDFDTNGDYVNINSTLARTSNLVDTFKANSGKTLCVRMSTIGTATTDIPITWWEVTQKNFTKKLCIHAPGHANPYCDQPEPPITLQYGKDAALWDATWYANFPDELFFKRYVWGMCSVQLGGGEDGDQRIAVISNPEAATFSPLDEAFNVFPELSTTPNATVGFKFRNAPIEGTDPVNVAGLRKLKMNYAPVIDGEVDWEGSGSMMLVYGLSVPNSEFLATGDLFALDNFQAEGCASTAAGLGDPGKLFITNGSSLPKMFDPGEGAIQDAGIPTPFPDEIPSFIVEDTALSPEGGIPDGTYIYRYTLRNCCTGKESDPNPDDIEVVVSGASPAGKVTLSFANVRIPGDDQVCEICLYRTVQNGAFPTMAKVGCFDPDETSQFIDDTADSELDFLNDPLSILNAPMPCVPYVVEFRNRLFGAGDIPQLSPAGTVSVENGSNIITGSDIVVWDRCLEGKFIQIQGDCRLYEIDKVLPPVEGVSPPIARLRLFDNYEGTDITGANYTITGHPSRLYYSEPLEGECWPVVNFIDVEPGDGDRITGLASNFDRLVIYKRRKTYVMTFRDFPAIEVSVPARVSSDIGCIAPRSPTQIESGTVALAERGLQLFDGRGVRHVPESDQANDIFVNPDNPRYVRRDIRGQVIEAKGVFYPKREQYLLMLPTADSPNGCNIMYVWDTSLRNVTIFEFCNEFLDMVVAKDASGDEVVYLGDVNGFTWAFDIGDTDGAGTPGQTGTVRGTVASAGTELGSPFIEDPEATFITGGLPELGGLSGVDGLTGSLAGRDLGLAGVCVQLRAPGSDVWITRTIFAATTTRLYISENIESDGVEAGWEYMVGAIRFEAVFKPFNAGTDDYTKRNWRQILVHAIEDVASTLKIELRADFSSEDQFSGDILNDSGEAGRVFDMDFPTGKQVRQIEKVVHTYLQIVMSNFAPEEPIRIINHILNLTPRASRH